MSKRDLYALAGCVVPRALLGTAAHFVLSAPLPRMRT